MGTRSGLPVIGACLVAACGGGDRDLPRTPPETRGPAATATPAATVDPADVRVVRAWADTLRRGDVAGASRYFALPSLVSNGTPPTRLRTRADVRRFNRALTCGARLLRTEPAPRGFLFATFELTERPGAGSCGSGTGSTARTAFKLDRRHRITDWLRVPDAEDEPEATPIPPDA